MKKHALIVLLLFAALFSKAQQSPIVSHYMFNKLLINPAYAGSKEYVSTTMLYRKQWAGIEGAPTTYSGSIHGLLKKNKLGIGFYMQQDKIGVTNQLDAYGSFAYHIETKGVGKFSLGMQLGFSNFSSEVVKLKYWDPGDKVFDYNTFSSLLPNAGIGLYYYTNLFYAGLSVPFVVSYSESQQAAIQSSIPIHRMTRRVYATVGGVIETEKDIKIRPSILLKNEANEIIQYDVNLNLLINDIFWIGATYRSSDALVALLEYQITRKFRIGYAYDYSLSDLSNYNSGSHEIMLGYDFGYPSVKMKSPRYF